MENLIGIQFFDQKYGEGGVITWGKVFENDRLLDVVKKCLSNRFGVKDIVSIKICNSLVEISDHPYFYECFILFMQASSMPVKNKSYEKWVQQKRRALYNTDEILFTGFKSRYQDYLKRKASGFSDDED
ncbi:MAG: hypothetical protein Q8Q60_00090 [Candidatus Chromulinivorax sp.]|nr:hypothetical protein [Candidatus Chromulinivorax sp.]